MAKSRARKLADIIVGAGIDIDGNLTFDGGSTSADLTFADNDKANFGDASDLQIYHDGSSNLIQGSNGSLYIQAKAGENSILATPDGGVNLYHDNSLKFETTSSGAKFSGTLTANDNQSILLGTGSDLRIKHDGTNSIISDEGGGDLIFKAYDDFYFKQVTDDANILRLNTGGDATFYANVALNQDNSTLSLGASSDLSIFHDGTDSFIKNDTGQLILRVASVESALVAVPNGAVSLYYDNSAKLATTSTGIQVTGNIDFPSSATILGGGTNTNMTIGTSSSGYQGLLKLQATGDIQLFQYGTSWTTNVTFKGDGQVGIGTTSPQSFVESSRFVVGSGTSGTNEMMFLYSGTDTFGAIGFADGTSGTERYRGIIGYHHDGDEMFFSTNGGGEAARDVTITSAGNVGIGTETPQEKLQINGNLRMFSAGYPLIDMGITTSNYFRFLHDNPNDIFKIGKNGAATLNISGGGNVGIGTASPGRALEVSTDGTAQFRLSRVDTTINGNNTLGTIEFWGNDDTSGTIGATIVAHAASTWGGGAYPTDLRFSTMETSTLSERMRITRLGDVSIGSDHGGFSGWKVLNIRQNSTGGMLNFEEDDGTRAFTFANQGVGMRYQTHITGGYHRFETHALGAGTAMMITDAGNVGIGTQSPAQHFEVNKASARMRLTDGTDQINFGLWDGTNYRLEGDANRPILITSYHTDGIRLGGSGNSHVVINSGGNVGIGTTSPERALHVVGGIHLPNNNMISWDQSNGTLRNAIYVDSGDDMIIGDTNFDDIYFSTGQKTKTVVIKQTTGRVGVGTTAPSSLVHASFGNQALGFDAGFFASANPSDYTVGRGAGITMQNADVYTGGIYGIREFNSWQGALAFYTHTSSSGNTFGTTFTEKMRIGNDGNVGIGTTSLTSITSNVATLSLGGTNAGVSGGIAYQTNGTVEAYHYTESDMLLHQAVAGVGQRFLTNNTEAMRIDTSQNIAIGVSSASARLDVRGGSGVGTLTHAVFTGTTNRGAEIRTRSDISGGQHSGCAEFNSADSEGDGGDIALSSNGNVRMFVHGAGNVGIGTTSPDAPLSIQNTALTTTSFDGTGGIRVHRPNAFGQYGWFEYGYNSDTTYIGSKYSGGSSSTYGQIWFAQDSNGGSRKYPLLINGSNVVKTLNSEFLGFEDAINILNADPEDGGSDFDQTPTNLSDGGQTFWEISNDGDAIYFSSTSGGHGGTWMHVYCDAGLWAIKGSVRLTNTDGAIHGSTSTDNYKFTHSFRFYIDSGPDSGTLKWDADAAASNTGTDFTRAAFAGAPALLSAGYYAIKYQTNGYNGVQRIYITDLQLVKVG